MLYAVIEVVKYVAAETDREFREKPLRGRVGFALATLAMASRAALLPPLLSKPDDEPWTWLDTGIAAGLFASDGIDGALARKLGGESTLGAVGDPILDKVATTALEFKLMLRGELDPVQLAKRGKRDLESTADRNEALMAGKKPNATNITRATTAARMFNDIISISPVGQKHPGLTRVTHRLVTRALLLSGNFNRKHYGQPPQD